MSFTIKGSSVALFMLNGYFIELKGIEPEEASMYPNTDFEVSSINYIPIANYSKRELNVILNNVYKDAKYTEHDYSISGSELSDLTGSSIDYLSEDLREIPASVVHVVKETYSDYEATLEELITLNSKLDYYRSVIYPFLSEEEKRYFPFTKEKMSYLWSDFERGKYYGTRRLIQLGDMMRRYSNSLLDTHIELLEQIAWDLNRRFLAYGALGTPEGLEFKNNLLWFLKHPKAVTYLNVAAIKHYVQPALTYHDYWGNKVIKNKFQDMGDDLAGKTLTQVLLLGINEMRNARNRYITESNDVLI